MATRSIVPHRNRGKAAAVGNKKPTTAAEVKSCKALRDIGNLVNVRILEGKPQQISRPITRSFCAQLLPNAEGTVAANKKSTVAAVVDDGMKAKAKVASQRAAAKLKPEPETVIEISPDTEESSGNKSLTNPRNVRDNSSKKRVETLTSVLTVQSKVAYGIKAIDDIDSTDSENQLAVVDYVEDICKFYRLVETSESGS